MAILKTLVFLLLISLLVLHLVEADESMKASLDAKTIPQKITNCGKACSVRCSLSSRPRLCKRACGTCCARCSCVPQGTYGHYDECPCYRDMKTHGGRPKCP